MEQRGKDIKASFLYSLINQTKQVTQVLCTNLTVNFQISGDNPIEQFDSSGCHVDFIWWTHAVWAHDAQLCRVHLRCGVRTEKCITSGERESLLEGCPGQAGLLSLGAPRLGRDSRGLSHTRSNSWDGDTHTPHIGGALTSGHWTRGHVSRQPAREFASQRTEELRDSHCERYLKHCPLRSQFYLAAVWLTDSNSSLLAPDIIVIIAEWESDTSINSEQVTVFIIQS